MLASQRIITELPLVELWNDRGPISAARSRDLIASDIRELLHCGPVRFVVADVGARPDWIALKDCFSFWKDEVQGHLADPKQQVGLDRFPDEYCYFATEWSAPDGPPIVVLERAH
jgi:hypothetical protein